MVAPPPEKRAGRHEATTADHRGVTVPCAEPRSILAGVLHHSWCCLPAASGDAFQPPACCPWGAAWGKEVRALSTRTGAAASGLPAPVQPPALVTNCDTGCIAGAAPRATLGVLRAPARRVAPRVAPLPRSAPPRVPGDAPASHVGSHGHRSIACRRTSTIGVRRASTALDRHPHAGSRNFVR